MALLVQFVLGLVAKAAANIAGESTTVQAGYAINGIVAQLPGDLGVMVVQFVTGLAHLWTAITGIFA